VSKGFEGKELPLIPINLMTLELELLVSYDDACMLTC
jgi:hypothetical protein